MVVSHSFCLFGLSVSQSQSHAPMEETRFWHLYVCAQSFSMHVSVCGVPMPFRLQHYVSEGRTVESLVLNICEIRPPFFFSFFFINAVFFIFPCTLPPPPLHFIRCSTVCIFTWILLVLNFEKLFVAKCAVKKIKALNQNSTEKALCRISESVSTKPERTTKNVNLLVFFFFCSALVSAVECWRVQSNTRFLCLIYLQSSVMLLSPIVFAIRQFSKIGLQASVPFVFFFVFFCTSHKRPQLPLPAQFLSRHWSMLCITMEVEPGIAKQLCLQKLQWKGD